jgi:hypothetical protein
MPDKNIANTSLAKTKARLPKAIGTKAAIVVTFLAILLLCIGLTNGCGHKPAPIIEGYAPIKVAQKHFRRARGHHTQPCSTDAVASSATGSNVSVVSDR